MKKFLSILLAVLLFRLAGGNAFGELRKGFREAMQENTKLEQNELPEKRNPEN